MGRMVSAIESTLRHLEDYKPDKCGDISAFVTHMQFCMELDKRTAAELEKELAEAKSNAKPESIVDAAEAMVDLWLDSPLSGPAGIGSFLSVQENLQTRQTLRLSLPRGCGNTELATRLLRKVSRGSNCSDTVYLIVANEQIEEKIDCEVFCSQSGSVSVLHQNREMRGRNFAGRVVIGDNIPVEKLWEFVAPTANAATRIIALGSSDSVEKPVAQDTSPADLSEALRQWVAEHGQVLGGYSPREAWKLGYEYALKANS